MSLDLGELRIALELDNDQLRASLAGAKREVESLPPTVRREMVGVTREMERGGRDSGGKLAQGINQGLIRNSPLIVAGVGAAIAAGAPLMTAAAGALFAGVGAVAAAQTVEVRAAWTNLGRDIRDSAVEDATVLVPVYTEMADRIGGAFRTLRPELRSTFEDSAPLIRSTTDGVIALATNGMPGLTRSIAGAGPVFDGFEHFLAETGQGLSDFFDALTTHSPAAGAAFASIGDLVGDLLPILGELLGQGAELASDVLPAVTTATGLALDVLQLLGPILPEVVAGFVAFKAAQTAAGYLQTFAVQAQYATIAATGSVAAGERVGGAMSKVADGVGRASAALPALGIVLAGVSADLSDATTEEERWAQAILAGGDAAAAAYAAYEKGTYWGRSIDEATGLASSWEDAKAKADEMRDAMSPLQRAQADVSTATNFLNEQVGQYGPASDQAAGASRALESAQRELERQQAGLELATHGVTQAMIEQANQALAAIDSGFAYRNSVDQLEDAQRALNDAIKEHGPASEEAARAQLAVEEQAYRTALSFGQQQADLSGLSEDSAEYARIVQTETLAKLYELQSAAGPEMKAAIGQQIAALEASGVKLGTTGAAAATTRQRIEELGLSVTRVPGNKTIFIDAPTAEQKQKLADLGYAVRTLPDGRVYVTADTGDAEANINFAARTRYTVIRVDEELGRVVRRGPGGSIPERAAGGPVWPGQTFLVGEKGPELVQFAGSGTVIPAEQTSRMLAPRTVGADAPAAAPAPVAAGSAVPALQIENYWEQPGSSPQANAEALAFLARTRRG